MEQRPITINLEDIVLEVNPIAQLHDPSAFLCLLDAKVIFPDGREVETGFRYDRGKQVIIDPILQDSVLKQYVPIDEATYLASSSASEFISRDANYQKWIEYRMQVNQELTQHIADGSISMKVR